MKAPKEIASKAERYKELKKKQINFMKNWKSLLMKMVLRIFGQTVLGYLKNQTEKNKQMENIVTNGCTGKIPEMEYITIRLKEVRNIFGQHIHFDWR